MPTNQEKKLKEDLLKALMMGLERSKEETENGYKISLKKLTNFKNSANETALHLACRENKIKAAKFFLEQKVDAIALNNQNQFAIELTKNQQIRDLIKTSKSWKWLEAELDSYQRIKESGSIDFNKAEFAQENWQKHIKKIELYEKFSIEESQKIKEFSKDSKSSQVEIILTKNEQISSSNNFEQAVKQEKSPNFQDLWREQKLKADKEEADKQEELKIRNRETNLMFAEEKHKKEADKIEEKALKDVANRNSQKLQAKLAKQKKPKKIDKEDAAKKAEEDLLLEVAIKEAQIQRVESKEMKYRQVLDFNKFLNEIHSDLKLSKEVKIDLEVPNLEEIQRDYLGNTLLIAVSKNKILAVEKILSHSLKEQFINFKDVDYNTNSLNIACAIGAFDIAKLLIEQGIDVKAFDSKKNSALHFCAAKKDQKTSPENPNLKESGLKKTVQSSEIAKMITLKCDNDWEFLFLKNSNKLSAAEICCKASGNWMVLKNILETSAYKTNSDNMTTLYLKLQTSGYEKHPENTDGKINEQVLRLLEIIEAVPQYKKHSENKDGNINKEVPKKNSTKQTPSSICAPSQGSDKLEANSSSVVGFSSKK